jgi:hypothetical protein
MGCKVPYVFRQDNFSENFSRKQVTILSFKRLTEKDAPDSRSLKRKINFSLDFLNGYSNNSPTPSAGRFVPE